MKKHYKILGLEEGASVQDIQDAYDKLLVELDPKNNDGLDFFKEELSLVQEAYEKLMGYFNDTADDDFSEKKDVKNYNADKSPINNNKNFKKRANRFILGFILLILVLFISVSVYNNRAEKVFGCIDPVAVNYDVTANVMKDSSCIFVNPILITNSRNKVEIFIDTNKYSQFNYDFVYIPDNHDTTVEIKHYGYGKYYGKNYISHTYKVSDTVKVSHTSRNRIVYSGDDVKVIEKLPKRKSRKYTVDIHQNGKTLINPSSFYRYKTETAVYERFPSLFGGPPNAIKKYNGFCINIEGRIDYWFEEHPSSITVYENEYSSNKYYRTNIIRY